MAGNRYIWFMGIGTGCVSGLYYLSLLVHLPLWAVIPCMLAGLFLIFRWLPADDQAAETFRWWHAAIPMAGIVLICSLAYGLASKYGQLDAWVTWNFHARYLSDPEHWAKLFQNIENDHPDYPLCLPAFIGFFLRLCSGSGAFVIPFVFSLIITLSIPVLIYNSAYRSNIIIATLALFLIAQDRVFIAIGVSQYADTLLAFFFLCAFICIDNVGTGGYKYVMLSAIFLGCCAWTKNEGIILAFIFFVFYWNVFFSRRFARYTGIAVIAPVAVIAIFKLTSHVQNDVVSLQNDQTVGYLFEWDRYVTIWHSFTANLDQKFYYLKVGFYIYVLVSFIKRKMPGRQMWLLIACIVAYMMVYVISPYPLEWHLSTSQDRLMHQLMPAMVYVLVQRFSGTKLSLSVRGVLQTKHIN